MLTRGTTYKKNSLQFSPVPTILVMRGGKRTVDFGNVVEIGRTILVVGALLIPSIATSVLSERPKEPITKKTWHNVSPRCQAHVWPWGIPIRSLRHFDGATVVLFVAICQVSGTFLRLEPSICLVSVRGERSFRVVSLLARPSLSSLRGSWA